MLRCLNLTRQTFKPSFVYSNQRNFCNRGEDRVKQNFVKGQVYHGFEVTNTFQIKEKNWDIIQLQHQQSKADYLHIDTSDMENTFGIVLKTLPDSSGVAHILEHTTLCGSKKYPVRDPFFNMIKRSVNTYMNAWTGYDWTAYPFSTQNKKDFNNLLRVYLDAVYFPNLNRLDFLQEGHRLELTDKSNLSSPVAIKGVVYNEMKGASSSPDRQILVKLHSELFPPHITYHHDSGGDPAQIPNLTYEQLLQFHKNNYHPSNSRFYSYGDLPLLDNLEYINTEILSKFESSNITSENIPVVNRFPNVKTIETTVAPNPGASLEDGYTALISYLTSDITNIEESFNLEILSSLLLRGSSSPFYKARMDKGGIGSDFSIGTGYSDSTKESTFGFGVSGIKENEIPIVYDMVDKTLDECANTGFSQERIDSVLHGLELQKKNTPSNQGLSIFGQIISPWVHNANIKTFMDVDKLINDFKLNIKNDTQFLSKLIDEHFMKNTHGIKLICRPDDKYNLQKEKEEEELISKLSSSLTEEKRKQILKDQIDLEEYQQVEQDRELLPKMELSDISKESIKFPVENDKLRKYNVQWNPQPTNELAFIRGFANIRNISSNLIPYIPIFCNSFASLGSKNYSYFDLSQRIQNYTGGVSSSYSIHNNYSSNSVEWGINFKSYALKRNISHMFNILKDVYTLKPEGLDQLTSIILNLTSSMEDKLMNSGHSFAMKHSARNITPHHKMYEQLSGISHLKFLQKITSDKNYEEILEKISDINNYLQNNADIRFAVNANKHLFSDIKEGLTNFVSDLSYQSNMENDKFDNINLVHEKVFVPLQSTVNFCSLSLPGVKYNHEDYAKLQVLSVLLSYNYLLPVIREKGGAYGAGLRSNEAISFYSYRDPNIESTIETYLQAPKWIKDHNNYSNTDIEEAKISLFGSIDSPTVPSQKGLSLFTQGITDEMRQQMRDNIFSVTKDDLIMVTEKYFENHLDTAPITVIGNAEHTPKDWTVLSLEDN